MNSIESKVNQNGKVISIAINDALDAYNEENGTMRAILSFAYQTDVDNDNDITALIASHTSGGLNKGNIIIELDAFEGVDINEKLENAINRMVDKIAKFSSYKVPVSVLNDEGHESVTNGEIIYTSLTAHYVGNVDEEVAIEQLRRRLVRQIESETLSYGDEEMKSTTRRRK